MQDARGLVPLERVRGERRQVDVATEIAREVAEMRALFDDGASAGGGYDIRPISQGNSP